MTNRVAALAVVVALSGCAIQQQGEDEAVRSRADRLGGGLLADKVQSDDANPYNSDDLVTGISVGTIVVGLGAIASAK